MVMARWPMAALLSSAALIARRRRYAVGVMCGHVTVDLSQFHCKILVVRTAVVVLATGFQRSSERRAAIHVRTVGIPS